MLLPDGTRRVQEDESWWKPREATDFYWIGETEFQFNPEVAEIEPGAPEYPAAPDMEQDDAQGGVDEQLPEEAGAPDRRDGRVLRRRARRTRQLQRGFWLPSESPELQGLLEQTLEFA